MVPLPHLQPVRYVSAPLSSSSRSWAGKMEGCARSVMISLTGVRYREASGRASYRRNDIQRISVIGSYYPSRPSSNRRPWASSHV